MNAKREMRNARECERECERKHIELVQEIVAYNLLSHIYEYMNSENSRETANIISLYQPIIHAFTICSKLNCKCFMLKCRLIKR